MGGRNGRRLCGLIILFLLLVNVFVAGQPVRANKTLPAVVSVTPSDNSSDVPLKTYPVVVFNEPVKTSTLAGSVNGVPITPLQAAFDNGNQTLRIDLGDMEYEKKYVVVISGSLKDTSGNTMGSDYTFSFTTVAGVSKRPTSTINLPTNPQPGETYTLTGTATGYIWQHASGPLKLIHYAQNGSNMGNHPMLHPTVLYFPNGEDGYKFYLIYTPYPPSADENPCLMRSNDGVNFTDAGVKNPLFIADTQPPYDSANLADPDALKVGNTWMIFYEMEQAGTISSPYSHIGLALSTDGVNYSPYGGSYAPGTYNVTHFPTDGNPIIHFSNNTWYEHDATPNDAYPRLGEEAEVFKDNTFHIWYVDFNNVSGTVGSWAVYANASDPRGNWTKLGPVLTNVTHLDVVFDPERNLYVMWYGVGSNYIATAPEPWGPWTNHPIRPIFQAQEAWEGTGLYRSSLVEVGTQWYLYYSANTSVDMSGTQIGVAKEVPGIRKAEISTDGGLTWTQLTTDADGDWNYSWTPTSSQTYLIQVRVTDDWMVGDPAEAVVNVGPANPNSWSKYAGNPILSTSSNDANVGFQSVFQVGNTYHMYYSYKNASQGYWMIGHATSTDKITWTKDIAHNPVLNLIASNSFCYCPIVWKEGSSWNMLYTGWDSQMHQGVMGRELFYATSSDGLSWTIKNNGNGVLAGTPGQWDSYLGWDQDQQQWQWYSDVEGWGLMKNGSAYYLWYDTLNTLNGSMRKTGLATSTNLINWTKDANNPIFADSSYNYYCASPYYFNGYYYLLIANPRFGIVLYRDPNPTFYSADRTNLGAVISWGSQGSWDSNLLDTPFILTDDITRVVNPATTIYTYYTGAPSSNVPQVGVTVMPSMEESLPPDYFISASSSALSLPAGSSGSISINLAPTNGFTGTVSLAASAPSGWSTTVYPSSVSVGSGWPGSSTLSITIPSDVSAGAYTVTAVATSNSLSHSTTVTVHVSTGPDYSVSASPYALTVVAGSSGNSTVTVTSFEGFSGTVSLRASAPSGWSTTVYPSSVSVESGGSGSSTLSITIPSTTSSGAYVVTVTGNSSSLNHPTSLLVNVQTVPSSPLSLVATPGNSQVTLSWSAPSSNGGSPITNYKVYRGGSSRGETLLTTIGNLLTYTDASVTNGQTYYYRVSAVNSVGESDLSNEWSAEVVGCFGNTNIGSSSDSIPRGYIVGGKYSPTSSGTVTKMSLYVRLDASGHVKVAIYSDANGVPGALLSQSDPVAVGTSFSWVNFTISQAVVGGTNYWLCWISDTSNCRFKESAGSTNQEAYATGIAYPTFPSTFPSPSYHNLAPSIYATFVYASVSPDYWISVSPSALTVVAGSSENSTVTMESLNGFADEVLLSASALSDWDTTFIPYSITGGSGSSTLSITVPSAATAGTYTVTVTGTSGSLTHSTTVTVTVQTVPSSPLSLVATAGNSQVTLSWSAPSSNGGSPITNYKVYRGGSSRGETLLTTMGNVSAYTDSAVTNGQTYYYQVTAVNSVGESGLSNEASATPLPAPDYSVSASPSALTIVAGSSGSSTVTVTSLNAFTGTVSLNASAPSGWSATVNPSSITGGSGSSTLSITVPSSAIAGAYTVTLTATSGSLSHSTPVSVNVQTVPGYFGNTNIGSSSDSIPRGYIVGGKYSPTSSGTVTKMSLYVRLDASGHVKVAIYSDANGVPGALLSQSDPVAVGTSFSWVNFTISQAVVGGTNYWLCWISDTSNCRFKESAGSTNQEAYATGIAYPTFPSTFPSPSYHNLAPSIYATVIYTQVNPDYSVSVSPSALTIVAGSSGSSTVTVTSLNAFTGTVSLNASAPSGWSATVNPSSITGGSGSSTLSITVPSSASAGTYTVTVTGTSGSLTHSTTVTVTVQTVPSPPQNLGATAGSSQVVLSWSAPSSNGGSAVTNYRIYRGGSSGGETLLTTIGNLLTYTDTAVTNGQTYYYQVTAVSSVGESGLSNEASATPLPAPDYSVSASPSALTIVAGSSGSSTVTVTSLNAFTGTVSLNASAPSGWSATVNPSSITGGSGSSTLSITVPSAATAGTYTVTVTGTSGSLTHSTTVTVTVQTVPSSPLSLLATAGDSQVTLSWSAPSSNGGSAITNYNIYRGTASGGETLLTTIGNLLTYTDASVTNGQTYYYKVSAVNSVGESGLSNEASATPSTPTSGTFGNTNIGSSTDSASKQYIIGGKYSPTSSGTVTKMSLYVRLDASGHVKVAIYSDANGVPGALLSQSDPVAVGTSFSWVNFTISQAVVGGTNYWLCWISDTSNCRFKESAGSTNQEAYATGIAYPTFPSTFPSPSYHNLAPSIYATVIYVPPPDYSVSVSPSALTIVAGSSGSSTVTVTSLNAFTGTVSLNASAPSGWSATVNPSSITGGSGSSTLSITVPSAATAGTYTVTVTGTSGSLTHSTTVTVTVQTVPSSPLSLLATAGDSQVTLSWSAPSSNGGSAITNYNIYRGTASGGETLLTTLGNVSAYTDTVVTNGQTYYYQVTAVNSVGESSRSSEASATPSVGNIANFGKTSVGSKSDSTGSSNYVIGCKYTMPESGSITKITAYIQSYSGTSHNGKAALYADNAGVPGAKLVESSEVSISSLGWYNFTVSYTNTQGVRTFWLAITVQGGWRYRYDGGSSNQEAYRPYAYPNFPDPFSPQGYHAFAMSIYATYTRGTSGASDALGASLLGLNLIVTPTSANLGSLSIGNLLSGLEETGVLMKQSIITILISIPLILLPIPALGITGLIIAAVIDGTSSFLWIVYWAWKHYRVKADFRSLAKILAASATAAFTAYVPTIFLNTAD